MIFSGSSQTIGVGASTLENTAFSLVATALAKRRPGLESLNIAQSGGQIVRQYEDYERLYLKFNPDLVVLNWSTNDPPNALRVGIQGFLETNKRLGIRTLLVAEANAVESGTPIREKHRILREMAKHYQVPLLDSHALFEERDKPTNDFVWWDQVHLTDQGQTWLAEFLEPAVLGLLPH